MSAKHKCGVFGIFGHPEAAMLTYLGIYALQHRGEESAGIATTDGKKLYSYKGMGLVGDVFNEEILKRLEGTSAIGHVRYSTAGSSLLKNAQPLVVDYAKGTLAIAHNGNLVNANLLRDQLEAYGSIFQTTLDSEIIVHLMAKPEYATQEEGLLRSLQAIKGAYSLLLLNKEYMIGVRDPHGFRPLVLGRFQNAYVLASETCALDLLEAEFIREIEPGEVVFISKKGIRSEKPFAKKPTRTSHCIFEHVYFARPDSFLFGDTVHLVRENLGRQLAREHPVKADIVIPVPDSGNSAALGYSAESGIPLEQGLIRNHYIGRTFIQPAQGIRDFKVRVKINFLKEVLKGKRVVIIDDSIVRGTTCKKYVKNLRDAGAEEVHMRISCPPIKHPCFYGIDFPSPKELIASGHSIEEIRRFLGADSLGYLSLEGLLNAVSGPDTHYCTACYSGEYPTETGTYTDKLHLERERIGTIGEGPAGEQDHRKGIKKIWPLS
ncbi:MAG: amidophosphoribosyltransferase [Candidatus Omnitrophica bacterium]|nr:amidophosphoribosyltransferase [Candidatus Omnitrophota bacterium]